MWSFRRTVSLSASGVWRGITDYHSHLLPGVDDGVKTLDESLLLLSEMEKQGFREVWLTPHIMEDIPNTTQALQWKFAELTSAYTGMMQLHLAAEYMLDTLFETRLENDDLFYIEKDQKMLLVETSYFNPPMNLYDLLERITAKSYTCLLAHPERYEYMQMADYRKLKEAYILFQLNIPSLVGMYGKHIQHKAELLLKEGMYDLKGNDLHSFESFRRVSEMGISKNVLELLTVHS